MHSTMLCLCSAGDQTRSLTCSDKQSTSRATPAALASTALGKRENCGVLTLINLLGCFAVLRMEPRAFYMPDKRITINQYLSHFKVLIAFLTLWTYCVPGRPSACDPPVSLHCSWGADLYCKAVLTNFYSTSFLKVFTCMMIVDRWDRQHIVISFSETSNTVCLQNVKHRAV